MVRTYMIRFPFDVQCSTLPGDSPVGLPSDNTVMIRDFFFLPCKCIRKYLNDPEIESEEYTSRHVPNVAVGLFHPVSNPP